MNHRARGLIRSSPRSELHENGSLQPSAETSTPCASNYALARQPLEGFQFGTLHAHRARRPVGRRSALGSQQSGRQPQRSRFGPDPLSFRGDVDDNHASFLSSLDIAIGIGDRGKQEAAEVDLLR